MSLETSIAAELRSRAVLYREAFSRSALDRFRLAPDRLRLATVGAEGRPIIPVFVDAGVAPALAALFPSPESSGEPSSALEDQKRALRIAQLDPDLDPLAVARWLAADANALLGKLAALYAKGAPVVRLAHGVVIETLRSALGAEASWGARAIAAAFVELALKASSEGLLGGASVELGTELALTTSPLAFGGDAGALAERPLNAYRTTEVAFQLARRVILEPVEDIALPPVIRAIADRLLLDDAAQLILARDTLLEMIRDAASLVIVQDGTGELGPLHELVKSFAVLLQTVLNAHRRANMVRMLEAGRFGSSKAIAALVTLSTSAEGVLRGETAVLGDLEQRALTAATGAVVLALDAHVESRRRSVAGAIEWTSREAYAEGNAYRFAFDDRPLYRIVRRDVEACVLVDVSSAVHRAMSRGAPKLAAEAIARDVYAPVLDAGRAAGDALRIVLSSGEAFAFSGDIVAALELALQVPPGHAVYVGFGPAAIETESGVIVVPFMRELSRGTERSPWLEARMGARFKVAIQRRADTEPVEVVNLGCAISGAALAELRRVRRGVLDFVEHRADGRVVIVASRAGSGEARNLFRFAGELDLDAPVEVWELISVESDLGRALLDELAGRRETIA